jgi:hypothetical protein
LTTPFHRPLTGFAESAESLESPQSPLAWPLPG